MDQAKVFYLLVPGETSRGDAAGKAAALPVEQRPAFAVGIEAKAFADAAELIGERVERA